MKFFYVAIALFLFMKGAGAQDLIVTQSGDSLNAKITRVKDQYIYFTFKYKDEIRNTLLQRDSVKYFQYGYYKVAEIPASKLASLHSNEGEWRLALNGGWSIRTAATPDNIPADEKNYIDGLKSGYHYGAEVTYFFSENIGVGIKSNVFAASNSTNATLKFSNGTSASGVLSDDISILFISPAFDMQIKSASKMNSFLLGLAIGYIKYTDNSSFNSDKIKITGSSLGLSYDVGYDFGLSKHVAIGVGISYVLGTITTIELTQGGKTQKIDLDKDSYEGLARFDFSAGLRFR